MPLPVQGEPVCRAILLLPGGFGPIRTWRKTYTPEVDKFFEQWVFPPRVAKAIRKAVRTIKSRGPKHEDQSLTEAPVGLREIMSEGWQHFRAIAPDSQVYAEFGSGESTVFMAEQSSATVRSVETDLAWVNLVQQSVSRSVELVFVDLGPTGHWGRPEGYGRSSHFDEYFSAPFAGEYFPDFILIDGRFRVACFAKALLLSRPGATIVIDDYVERSRYHVVEEILVPDYVGSRQAFFKRPERLSTEKVEKLLDKFEFVMD